MTTAPAAHLNMDIEEIVAWQDKMVAEAKSKLPEGYVLAGVHLYRTREDLPDCITFPGKYGPIEIQGIPYRP